MANSERIGVVARPTYPWWNAYSLAVDNSGGEGGKNC